jgi:hypothetical protein
VLKGLFNPDLPPPVSASSQLPTFP